jgi:hypothetical protein
MTIISRFSLAWKRGLSLGVKSNLLPFYSREVGSRDKEMKGFQEVRIVSQRRGKVTFLGFQTFGTVTWVAKFHYSARKIQSVPIRVVRGSNSCHCDETEYVEPHLVERSEIL